MATYILLSRLTDEGCTTLVNKPERIEEVNRDVEAMGGKVLMQFVLLGPYDFLNVVEAPNNETIAKISTHLAARGTVRIQTFPAVDVKSFVQSLK